LDASDDTPFCEAVELHMYSERGYVSNLDSSLCLDACLLERRLKGSILVDLHIQAISERHLLVPSCSDSLSTLRPHPGGVLSTSIAFRGVVSQYGEAVLGLSEHMIFFHYIIYSVTICGVECPRRGHMHNAKRRAQQSNKAGVNLKYSACHATANQTPRADEGGY
jgi:hypothetical protein